MIRRHRSPALPTVLLIAALALLLGCGLLSEAALQPAANASALRSSPTPPPIPTHLPVTPTVRPSAEADLPAADEAEPGVSACTNQAALVAHVTIPIDMEIPATTAFTKIWQVENIGTCVWATDYQIVLTRGEDMTAPTTLSLDQPVPPAATVDIAIPMVAPSDRRNHWGEWMLQTPDGQRFGIGPDSSDPLLISIEVLAPPTPTPQPTSTPRPTSTPMPVIVEWEGSYYATKNLSGSPALVRNDSNINFNWGENAPDPILPVDLFSARWTRRLSFDTGLYQFNLTIDDGARFWIDGDEVFNDWNDNPVHTLTRQVYLKDDIYDLKLEYFENVGQAEVRLNWSAVPDDNFPDWKGRYWDNRKLDGSRLFQRNDPNLDFDWGKGPVVLGMPDDNFSARWTREADFKNDTYTFTVRSEGGVRVYVDDVLIIDEWTDDGTDDKDVSADVAMTDGNHDIKVEYYNRSGSASVKLTWER